MGARRPIYLDHQATTPCDPRVLEAMWPYFGEEFGNAASRTHAYGWQAEQAVDLARREVAGLIGADPREIVFTSGATESNNLAILGAARGLGRNAGRIVTCTTEHRAVLDPAVQLEAEGFEVIRVGVDRDGLIDYARLRAALQPSALLVSVMHANNEIGVIQDLPSIAELCRARGVLLHSDAAQSVGKIEVDVNALGVDLLSVSAHKLYGPKGVGALYVRRRRPPLSLQPLVWGGGHERGLRSGTLPVALCVGFGRACELAGRELDAEQARLRDLRDGLWAQLRSRLDGVWLNGDAVRRLPGNLNVGFRGVEGEALIMAASELALSAGSACTSARREPSHVLRALGLSSERSLGSLRLSLGRTTSTQDAARAADILVEQVGRLRG